MSQGKSVYTKLGSVMQNDKGHYVVLGDSRNKNPQYNFTVEYRVLNNEGQVVAEGANGFLSLFDPRKRPGITEEQAARIPESVVYELFQIKK